MSSLLGTCLVGASLCATQASEDARELMVQFVDTTGLEREALGELEDEVETIYRTAGVTIHWVDTLPVDMAPHMARVYLLEQLPASLDTRLRAFRGTLPMALGLGNGGAKSSFGVLYVSRDRVATTTTNGAIVEPGVGVLTRALGRVVAHELAHRFLQREHTRHGVLKADFSSSDLTGDGRWARFSEREAERLREVAVTVPLAASKKLR